MAETSYVGNELASVSEEGRTDEGDFIVGTAFGLATAGVIRTAAEKE